MRGSRLRRVRRGRRRALRTAALSAVLLSVAAAALVLALQGDAPAALIGCDLARTHPVVTGGTTLLSASDGSSLGSVPSAAYRVPVAMRSMSPWLPEATVAIEDRRFWHHGALDALGIARSVLADLTSGHVVQGASTITQQLVRNRYLGGEPMTLSRKLTESCLAVQLFRRWPRSKILESYLNTVFYGDHARGAQAAALTYFSRPAAHLSLPESALLAGLPQAPSRDDPLLHPAAALARRNQVLAAMHRAGELSLARYRTARRAPLGLHPARPATTPAATASATFVDAARTELSRRVGAGRARDGGLRVQTTLQPRTQRLAQQAISHWIGTTPGPAAALVAVDPRTGAVPAMASRAPGAGTLAFNLATQSRRQAGSAFKVFTLATALHQGIPLSSVWSGPPSLTIPDPRCENADGPWVVHNFADESSGTMDLTDAIAHSVNTIFAQVAVRVGPQNITATAQRMGITTPLTPVCSITLGPEGVSPLEMTDAFATLASGGVHHAPELLRSVTAPGGASVLPAPAPGNRVLTPTVSAQVTYALIRVIKAGTGTAADPGRPAAGKTGTAENSADAWFCGYVPQLAACVWVGSPSSETPMTSLDGFSPVVGGSVPARIWHDFMTATLAGRPVEPLRADGPAPAPSLAPALVTPPGPSTTTPTSAAALPSIPHPHRSGTT
ncbi:transglycosylase domain-containing protein [Baekduia soli]|nr:transglycosylase domain-containing protein [Baekduia soli]